MGEKLTCRHFAALDALPSCPPAEGVRPGELAHVLGKKGDTMSRILFDLREMGLAVRDERTYRHSINPAGRSALARHRGETP